MKTFLLKPSLQIKYGFDLHFINNVEYEPMLAKLKPMADIQNDPNCIMTGKNGHYWKFYYRDKDNLGFRDFYLKYWRGDRFVKVKPKRDRKKRIIQGKFEVYGKRGNYVFTCYGSWFEWTSLGIIEEESDVMIVNKKPKGRDIARINALPNLSWNDLFEM